MSTGSLVPSELSILGIAKQATLGTPTAATNFLRNSQISPQPNVPYLQDSSMEASMAAVHDLVVGQSSTSFELDGYLYADEVNWFLASLLADLTVTGSSDPYTSALSLLNSSQGQVGLQTITDWNGADGSTYSDLKANEFSASFSADALATYSAKYDGTVVTGSVSKPTVSFSGTRALPAWQATFGINSVAGVLVTDASIDIKRTNTPVPALGAASVNSIFNGGDLDVSGSFTQVYDTTNGNTVYGYYKAGTIVPVTLNLDTGATPDRQVKFQMTTCAIDKATPSRSTGKYMELACTYHGIANSTDVGTSAGTSPVKATTKAGLPSGTYA